MSKKKQYVVTLDDDDLKNAPESFLEYLRKKGALKPTDDVSPPSVPLQAEDDASRGHTARYAAREREQFTTQLSRLLKSPQASLVLPDVLKQVGLPFNGISKEEPSERSEFAALLRLRAENDQRKTTLEELRAELRAEQDQARELEAEIQRLKRQNPTSRTGGPGEQQQIEKQATQDPVVAELLAKLEKQEAELAELKQQRTAGPVDVPMRPARPTGQSLQDDAKGSGGEVLEHANAVPRAATPPAASTDDIAASSPASPGSNADEASASGSDQATPAGTPEPDPSDDDDELSSNLARTRRHPSVSGLRPSSSDDPRSDPAPLGAAVSPTGSNSTTSGNGGGASSTPSSPPSESQHDPDQSAESAKVLAPSRASPGPSTLISDFVAINHQDAAIPLEAQSASGQSVASSPLTPLSQIDFQGQEDVDMTEGEAQESDNHPEAAAIDVDEIPVRKPRTVQLPKEEGPYGARLKLLLKAADKAWPEKGLGRCFSENKFIGRGVIHVLLGNCLPDGYFLYTRPTDWKRSAQPNGFVIIYFVNYSNQLATVGQNHWVVAVVDLKNEKYISWGMEKELREREAQNLGLGSFTQNPRGEIDSDGFCCALRCVEAVRIHFGLEKRRKEDTTFLRWTYLKELVQIYNREEALKSGIPIEDRHRTAADADPDNSSTTSTPVDPEVVEALEAQLKGSAEASPSRQQPDTEAAAGDGVAVPETATKPAAPNLLGKNEGTATFDNFTSAGFALALPKGRKPLPTSPRHQPAAPTLLGDREAPSTPAQFDATSGNTTPPASDVFDRVSYTWMTPESEGHQKTIGGRVLLLKPTPAQYENLFKGPPHDVPWLFAVAEKLGAREHGACVIDIPETSRPVLPEQRPLEENCTTYKVEHLENGFVRLSTEHHRRTIPSTDELDHIADNIDIATQWYRELLSSTPTKKTLQYDQKKDVAYKTDIPAHTAEERKGALVPEQSPIYPIRGSKLLREAVPGINTPTAYRGTPYAPFGWHFEDLKLGAFNCLYRGKKVWKVTEPGSFETATTFFKETVGETADHDQFMRHESHHLGIEQMQANGIVTRCFVQSAWQIVVLYPGVYHSGFSMTATLAEAVNYADNRWTEPKGYLPCFKSCDPGHQPVTFEKIFQNGHEGQQADNDRRTDEQYGTNGQQTNTAGCRRSMRTKPKPQRDAPSVEKDTGGEQHTADGQHSGSEQKAGPRRSTRRRSQASSDVTVSVTPHTSGVTASCVSDSALTKRPATAIPAAQPPAKKLKGPDLKALAECLLDADAVQRFTGLVTAWKEMDLTKRPSFNIGEKEVTKKVAAFWNRSFQLARAASLNALLSLLMRMQAVTIIDKVTENDGRTNADPKLLHEIHARLEEEISYKAFRNRLSVARTFKRLRAWVVFLPFQGAPRVGIRDYEALQAQQAQEIWRHLNNPELYRRADEFCQSILGGEEFRRLWENMEPV